jgi:hypothetical protein
MEVLISFCVEIALELAEFCRQVTPLWSGETAYNRKVSNAAILYMEVSTESDFRAFLRGHMLCYQLLS